jgi:hypothetical protein
MPLLFLLASRLLAQHRAALPFLVLACLWSNAVRNGDALKEWALFKKPLYSEENAFLAGVGMEIEKAHVEGLRLGVVSAGHLGYYSGLPCEDLFGKSDRFIAHLPVHPYIPVQGWRYFSPGHAKWDYPHLCAVKGPFLILQLPFPQLGEWKQLKACGFAEEKSVFGMAFFKP